jgi:hypothetical protein
VGEVDEGHTSDTEQEMTIFQKSHVERAFHGFIYNHRTKRGLVTRSCNFFNRRQPVAAEDQSGVPRRFLVE